MNKIKGKEKSVVIPRYLEDALAEYKLIGAESRKRVEYLNSEIARLLSERDRLIQLNNNREDKTAALNKALERFVNE